MINFCEPFTLDDGT
jgi:hypothetical protein